MAPNWQDTIAAIASAPGGAARGIIRISGEATRQCLSRCFPDLADRLSGARDAQVFASALPENGRRLACDVYFWPTLRSYTREPAAELHLIGSPPLLQAALAMICENGARTAEPGEFTLRAFLAGRIDLTQAEAVLGVIDAQDPMRLDRALQQMAGGLSQPLHALRERLLELLAHLEAGLDFVDEDIEFISAAELQRSLKTCEAEILAIAAQMRERSVEADDLRVVLRGLPNAGKSSLFNALLGRDAALVSDQQGTTRDYLVGQLVLGAQRSLLVDTAGLDDTADDMLERTAQQQTSDQARAADVELFCVDATVHAGDHAVESPAADSHVSRIVVMTKCDLKEHPPGECGAIWVSSVTGEGLMALKAEISKRLSDLQDDASTTVAATAARCRDILHQGAESLQHAIHIHGQGGGEELIAAELRMALDALGRVVGVVYTDDILDRIFSRFCIGK